MNLKAFVPKMAAIPMVPNTLIWLMVAGWSTLTAIAYIALGLPLEVGTAWWFPTTPSAFAALAIIYHRWRPHPKIVTMLETTAQLFAILFLAALVTFAAAHAGRIFPFRDDWLLAADVWLGFDTVAYLQFFNERPMLAQILHIAYPPIMPQFAIVGVVLVMAGHVDRMRIFLVATSVVLFISILLFMLLPAVSAVVYIASEAHSYGNLRLTVPNSQFPRLMQEIRAEDAVVRLDDLEGLITFPSYHLEAAMIFVWAFWCFRFWRWPVLILNVLIAASIPSEGSHYFIDIVGGIPLAVGSIMLAKYLCRARSEAVPI